jgi:hypothetical protein
MRRQYVQSLFAMTGGRDRWSRMATALAPREGVELSVPEMCLVCAAELMVFGVGIALVGSDQSSLSSYASNSVVEQLEEHQFTLGVGPASDAHGQGVPIIEDDVKVHPPTRWLGFAAMAAELGICAVYSFPLQMGAVRLGAMTFYHDCIGPLESDHFRDALVMATVLTVTLLSIHADLGGDEPTGALLGNEVVHAEVHQASGMISAQLDVNVGEALVLLRARAFAEGTAVSVLAGDVVARRLRFDPWPPRGPLQP